MDDAESVSRLRDEINAELARLENQLGVAPAEDWPRHAIAVSERWATPLQRMGVVEHAVHDLCERMPWHRDEWTSESDQRRVLYSISTRIRRCMRELRLLLTHGCSASAWGIVRMMYELHVVAEVLRLGDAEASHRYTQHAVVNAIAWIEDVGQLSGRTEESLLPLDAAREHVAQHVEILGTGFLGPYGWAASTVRPAAGDRFRPSFRDLDEFVGMGHLRSIYRLACGAVHGSALTSRLEEVSPPTKSFTRYSLATGPNLPAQACFLLALHHAAGLVEHFVDEADHDADSIQASFHALERFVSVTMGVFDKAVPSPSAKL